MLEQHGGAPEMCESHSSVWLGGFGLAGKAWITLSRDKGSAIFGKVGEKGLWGMTSDVGRFTKDLERSEEFCRKEKSDIIANTAKHVYQRVQMQLPHCKVMQLSHREPSAGREGRGFTCRQAQQSDLKRGLLMHADTHLQKHRGR